MCFISKENYVINVSKTVSVMEYNINLLWVQATTLPLHDPIQDFRGSHYTDIAHKVYMK